MSRPWVGVASFRAASTPSSLRSITSSFKSTALSPMTLLLLLLLFSPRLSPLPSTSLGTHSRTSSGSFSAESSSPSSTFPNSLTPTQVLKNFNEISFLRIELPSGELGIEDGLCFLERMWSFLILWVFSFERTKSPGHSASQPPEPVNQLYLKENDLTRGECVAVEKKVSLDREAV
ncbi:hypothetical protein SO802_010682 [Lithocarpus litseifolius]|uniref:Uncharacterized protein n=1 Tax=Lithocarpus litseifolius TaxID=425828 RepID=A0AAW2DEW2_9ROSI